MGQIDLMGTSRIQFDAARDAVRMWPGVGGARLELTMSATRLDGRKDAPPCQVSAAMSISRMAHSGLRFVCDVKAPYPVSPLPQATQLRLNGFISDHQLRVIEAIRRGGPLVISLEFYVSCVDGEPGRLITASGDESIHLQPGEWASALERADAGSYVELLVPLPANEDLAIAVRRLRDARDLVRDNKVEQALGGARKAIESVRAALQTRRLANAAEQRTARQRTKEERWAIYVESVFSLLSAAVHDDAGTTEHFVWSRAEAETLIVSAAGMLTQLAESER